MIARTSQVDQKKLIHQKTHDSFSTVHMHFQKKTLKKTNKIASQPSVQNVHFPLFFIYSASSSSSSLNTSMTRPQCRYLYRSCPLHHHLFHSPRPNPRLLVGVALAWVGVLGQS